MQMRKLIAFGESTYSITLPKKWVEANRLKKGDLVSVEERGATLEVSPGSAQRKDAPKKIVIQIASKPIKEIEREFTAAYIKGYSIIELAGSHEGKVSEIRRRLHNLIAVEVMEVASSRITAHVFSDLSTVSLPKIVSHIEIISRNIFDDTQAILRKSDNRELRYKEIMEKKLEVDRQSLFAIRIIVQALTNPSFASQVETDTLRLSFTWHLTEYMEKVSDYLLSVAFDMCTTDVLEDMGRRGREDLFSIFSDVKGNYEAALKSFNMNSVPLANQVFDSHIRNGKQLYAFLQSHLSLWVPTITSYLRRASSRTRDIARLTINLNAG